MADMLIGTNGIVFDQRGRVLLILRDDILTWALPGGGLEPGELPTEGVVREVAEETGLKVKQTALAGVYFWAQDNQSLLVLAFLCQKIGGELTTSAESLQVGFKPVCALPRLLLPLHRERIQQALVHNDGRTYWGEQQAPRWSPLARKTIVRLIYGWKNWQRKRKKQPAYEPPLPWRTGAFTVIRNDKGQVLWLKRTDHDVWNLPGGKSEIDESPWQTAIRETKEETGLDTQLTGLSGVYVKPAENEMIFCFTATVTGGQLTLGPESACFAYFASGQEPENTLPKQVARVVDTVGLTGKTHFKVQDGPSGLQLLNLI